MVETRGLDLVKGRTFSRALSSDTAEVILNQADVDKMGGKDPIGMKFGVFGGDGMRTVGGVGKDFHFESMHTAGGPFALRLVSQYTRDMMVKIRAGSGKNVIGRVQQTYAKAIPGVPFEDRVLD